MFNIRKIYLNLSIICLLLIPFLAKGNQFDTYNKSYANGLNYCKITKQTVNEYEPKQFNKSNNLLNLNGIPPLYCGENIILYGRILDHNCAPISDARIELWQANCDGKYIYQPLKSKFAINYDLFDFDNKTTFTGNGTAITNNMGYFTFSSIYPKSVLDQMPQVNLKITYKDIETSYYSVELAKARVKDKDYFYELSHMSQEANKMGVELYYFTIILGTSGLQEY